MQRFLANVPVSASCSKPGVCHSGGLVQCMVVLDLVHRRPSHMDDQISMLALVALVPTPA
jgi:hypothetical protein